jgi:D-alanine-D-alanine ligase-like ATP-grasp enzyme
MNNTDKNKLYEFINDNISNFHQSRINSLNKLKLIDILKRKNIYLYKAKNIQSSEELIKAITDAYLSSQEETIFGEFLEKLAIFIAQEQ